MRHLILAAASSLVLSAAAVAATPDAQLTAPIRQFVDSFNKGDSKAAAATHVTTDLAIIDEVAPHLWTGAGAFKAWSDDLASDAQKRGLTDQSVTIGEPTRQEVAGDRAYVIVPAVYSFKDHGVSMSEPAQWTFVLKKGEGGWKIAGWTWTGPKPQPDKAHAKR